MSLSRVNGLKDLCVRSSLSLVCCLLATIREFSKGPLSFVSPVLLPPSLALAPSPLSLSRAGFCWVMTFPVELVSFTAVRCLQPLLLSLPIGAVFHAITSHLP